MVLKPALVGLSSASDRVNGTGAGVAPVFRRGCPEPALAGAREDALLAVAEEAGELSQRDVRVAQVVLRLVAAYVVDDLGEGASLCGQLPLQRARVYGEV